MFALLLYRRQTRRLTTIIPSWHDTPEATAHALETPMRYGTAWVRQATHKMEPTWEMSGQQDICPIRTRGQGRFDSSALGHWKCDGGDCALPLVILDFRHGHALVGHLLHRRIRQPTTNMRCPLCYGSSSGGPI